MLVNLKKNKAGADEEFKNFKKWSEDDLNKYLLAVLTILSGADIKMLNLLSSGVSIYKIISFNALFSKSGRNIIFRISFLNIFIHDAPLVVTQVRFKSLFIT